MMAIISPPYAAPSICDKICGAPVVRARYHWKLSNGKLIAVLHVIQTQRTVIAVLTEQNYYFKLGKAETPRRKHPKTNGKQPARTTEKTKKSKNLNP